MLNDLINSLDNSLDTKPLVISRQMIVPSGNIPNFGNNANGLKKIETFWLTGYKGNNNIAMKRLSKTKISEYQRLEIRKLL